MKISSPEYPQFLAFLKSTIRERQYQALRAVNHELLALYLEIGEAIYRKQEELGWGKSVVENLALSSNRVSWPEWIFCSESLVDAPILSGIPGFAKTPTTG